MKEDNIQQIAKASVLQSRLQTRRFASDALETDGTTETKNLCAKMAPSLVDEVQNMARFLGVSKRLFVEQALIDALNRAAVVIWEQADDDQDHPGCVPDFVYKRVKPKPQAIEDLVSDPTARPGFQGLGVVEEVQP